MIRSYFQRSVRTLALVGIAGAALVSRSAMAFDSNGGDADGGADCPHIGVETVPASVGGAGPTIACTGGITLKLGYKGISGELTWSGSDCPSWVQIIPSHDKQIHKFGYKITSTVMTPRVDLYYYCDYEWINECIFKEKKDGAPPVQHSYEAPCPIQF